MVFDGLIVMAIVFITASLVSDVELPGWVRGVIAFSAFFLYEPLMVSMGGTIGHRTNGLTVKQRNRPDRNLSFSRSFLRSMVKLTLGLPSFLTLLTNREKRALHDLATGSIVLYR